MKRRTSLFVILLLMANHYAFGGQGKLLATAGLQQVEGAGGGGIVPWATLAGYDTEGETSLTAFATRVSVDDYSLDAWGAAWSWSDRIELSVARHSFDVEALGAQIAQNIYGAKVRLWGDVVYGHSPQFSFGVQHKALQDAAIANLLGASDDADTDFYLSATKVHLGAVAGYNLVWNLTARATRANQLGLLGFGAENNNTYEWMAEGSIGVLLSPHLVIGAEYRQKPDFLGIGEDDWYDIFIAYIPNKSFNVTLAWTDLGNIAGAPSQSGLYLSLGGQLW